MSEPAIYHCEGCGTLVFHFSSSTPPAHGFCAICLWMCEHINPSELMEMRRRCEPGGWEGERAQRRHNRIEAINRQLEALRLARHSQVWGSPWEQEFRRQIADLMRERDQLARDRIKQPAKGEAR
jgi:hypothetical protein